MQRVAHRPLSSSFFSFRVSEPVQPLGVVSKADYFLADLVFRVSPSGDMRPSLCLKQQVHLL